MALWVRNNYKTQFVIKWGKKEYILNANDDALLPDEVVKAFFPTYDDLKEFLSRDPTVAIMEMRSFLDIYLSRWGFGQIEEHYKLTGNVEADIDNFFEFIQGFIVSEKKFAE